MDWNELLNNGIAMWGAFIALGGNTVVNIYGVVKSAFQGKKFTNVTDFVVTAYKMVQAASTELKQVKQQFDAQIDTLKTNVIQPLEENVAALSKDNKTLVNLVVAMLSLMNVPLEQKKSSIVVLQSVGSVTQEAINALDASVKVQEQTLAIEKESTSNLSTSIENL